MGHLCQSLYARAAVQAGSLVGVQSSDWCTGQSSRMRSSALNDRCWRSLSSRQRPRMHQISLNLSLLGERPLRSGWRRLRPQGVHKVSAVEPTFG